jgi:L-phenylalanine/L-methionine N-acetyltransferase
MNTSMTRKATQNDLQFVYDLYMHPQVNPHLLYENMDLEQFSPIYEDLLNDDVKYIFEENGTPAGMFKLICLKHRCSHIAYIGGLAIHPDFAGKGFGVKMMQEIIELAKENNLLRLELSVGSENKVAQKLYQKVGFEKEGILRKYTHLVSEGRFLDEVMMAYLV